VAHARAARGSADGLAPPAGLQPPPPHRRTAAPPHRRTAAPPHRRTAAPPHRRTAAPPQVFGVLEEDVAQDARMHAQLASLSAVLPSQLDVNQRFLDTRFNRWDAAPIPNPNPNPKPDP
jgi:hypothetical protein